MEKDYLYRNNKYTANDRDIKVDKNFIRKRRLRKIIELMIFLAIVGVIIFGFIKLDKPSVKIDDNRVYINTDISKLDTGDKVAIRQYKQSIFEDVIFYLGQSKASEGEIINIPLEYSNLIGAKLDNNTYIVQGVSKDCKGELFKVKKNEIYGIIKGSK